MPLVIFILVMLGGLIYCFFAYYYITIPSLLFILLLRLLFLQARDRSFTLVTDCVKCGGTGRYSTSLDEDSGGVVERLCSFCGGEGCSYCKNRGKT
jgi:hypothetical protein